MKSLRKKMETLHHKYVFAPADKAANNVIIIWKRHYVEVIFARNCTSVLEFHSKNLQITSKLLTQGYRYHKRQKKFGKFFRSYSELLSKFGDISFQVYLSKGISHPVFYGDLV